MSDQDVAFDPTVATPGSDSRESVGATTKDRHERMAEDFVGQVLGERYELKRIVGAGGFGAVFEAEDRRIRKRVAVKLLFADLLRDREAVIRFKLEAEAASQVGHRHIINITDFDFTEDGVAYMVMEFLQGEDLAHIIRGAAQPDLARVVRLCLQACRGLGAAHRKGIVHRDLKPGNIFVAHEEGEPPQVKVVDFGISRASELDVDSDERLTKTGQILGTPYYMAPEQADGVREVDGRTDIYALGIILYEGATGRLPFTARTPIGLITKHASEAPRPPSEHNPRISSLLENTILKALEKDPVDRFQDMTEMEKALLGCLADLDPTAAAVELAQASGGTESQEQALSGDALIALTTPSSVLRHTAAQTAAPRKRPVTWLAALGLVGLVAVGVTLWWLWGRDGGAPSAPPGRASAAVTAMSNSGAAQEDEDEARRRAHPRRGAGDDAQRRPGQAMGSSSPAGREGAARPAPRRPRRVTIRCRTRPRDVRVTDAEDEVTYGVCPGRFQLPHGLEPLTLYLRHRGYIPQKVNVLPNRDRALPYRRLTPLRRRRPTTGTLPDDVITQ